jgi:hypothetical protein
MVNAALAMKISHDGRLRIECPCAAKNLRTFLVNVLPREMAFSDPEIHPGYTLDDEVTRGEMNLGIAHQAHGHPM